MPMTRSKLVAMSISTYNKKGTSFLDTLNEKELMSMIKLTNNHYYNNDDPLMTDSQYDMLKEYIEERFPNNVEIKKGHTDVDMTIMVEKSKVKLPYEMWSMDKIKDEKSINRKLKKYKGPYVVSAKMDGISALYYNEDGSKKLYTRGNGKVGLDISWMLDYIDVPDDKITVRGELIMKKNTFNEKYKKDFANPRNFVSGVANSKNVNIEYVKDIDFVVYEVVSPIMKPSEQIRYICKNFSHPVKAILYKKVNKNVLSELLLDWRENLDYEIDGIIVCNDKVYERISGNPEHAFAFKMVMSDQIVESMVMEVLWSPSKDGYLKPKLKVKPVVIGGATIQYVTAHNAAYVVNNNIGVGSVIQIIRSGDIIPKVHKIVHDSGEPNLPEGYEYKWNKNKVDFILVNAEDNEIVNIKRLDEFFNKIGVVGLGRGNLKRMFDAGFTSLKEIINMKMEDYLTVEGFKEKLSSKIMDSIEDRLSKVEMSSLMAASNVFGRGMGIKKLDLIISNYPDILTNQESLEDKMYKVLELEGFSEKTSSMFVDYIENFVDFMKDLGLESRMYESVVKNVDKHVLNDKKIVMSGAKDKVLKKRLSELGIKLSTSVSKSTDYVIVTDMNESTNKIEKAKKLNVKIILASDFMKKYL